ncbi:hypothetical protein CFE70_007980 [Pyrenophora teres f. teres 0-1]
MSRSMSTSYFSVQSLTTEIVENVTRHSDNEALLNFAAASPRLRSKSYYIYGAQFFATHRFPEIRASVTAYLSLQFANFKAAVRYQWTGAEAKAFKEKNYKTENSTGSGMDILDNQNTFLIPGTCNNVG